MTDAEVVKAIASKQPGALKVAVTFLYRHKGYITGFVKADADRALLRFDQAFCDDLFQEVIVSFLDKVWHGQYTILPGVQLTSYLYAVSYRQYLKLRRREMSRLMRENEYVQFISGDYDERAGVWPDEDSGADEIGQVDALLNRLNEDEARLIRWFDLENDSHRAIGDRLGISEAAAKQRYYRARIHLGALIKTYELSG